MIIGGTLEQLKTFIQQTETIAFDVETTGVDKNKDKVIGFSIAGRDRNNSSIYCGYYVGTSRYEHLRSGLVDTGYFCTAIEILNLLKTKKLVTWNGSFDSSMTLRTFGVDIKDAIYIDGMLLAHTTNENEFDYRLKSMAKRVFGEDAGAAEDALKAEVLAVGGKWTKENKTMYMASTETLGKYAIQDGILTLKLVDEFLPYLKAEKLEELFYGEVMPLYRLFTIPAERGGIKLDMPLLLSAQENIAKDINALEVKILEAIAPNLDLFKAWLLNKDYPPSRSGAFIQEFCKIHKPNLPYTKSGNYSLTADALANLEPGYVKQVLCKEAYMLPEDVHACQNALWKEDGKPWFNLQSKHHLKKLFFDTLKEKPLSTTPTGQPQADDEFLELMTKKYAWAVDLRTYNRLNKLKSTYMDRFVDAQHNGRFYPSFYQHRTVSGRLAGDLQQLPRPIENPKPDDIVAKYQNLIRAFFIADENWTFVDDDYDSAEPRVFAHVSNEQKIKDIFKLGHDFYSTMGINTEKLDGVSADKKAPNYLGKVNKEKRQAVKVYALGIPYGLGGYKLQYELNIALSEAEKLVSGFWAGHPDLAKEVKKAHEEALEHGFVRNEAGRIRHLDRAKEIYSQYGSVILDDLELWKKFNDMPGLYARAKQHRRELKNLLNNAFNFKVQGLVASIINRATILIAQEIEKHGFRAKIIAQIHDQLIVHAHIEDAARVGYIVQTRMENAFPLTVPLPAIPSYGPNMRDSKGT